MEPTIGEEKEDTLILTRYLYSKVEVKHSLFIALLNRAYDEVLFWAYELYFSGFEDEVNEYVLSIYTELYETNSPTLRKYIEKTLSATDVTGLGSVLVTLLGRQYSLALFIQEYFQMKCTDPVAPVGKPILVRLSEEQIQPYLTRPPDATPRLYLRQVCRYPVHKELATLFKSPVGDFTDKYRMNWLYYAARSPIWLDRISEYGGVLDTEAKCVLFLDDDVAEDDADSLEETFYLKWGLEPDEQPLEIQQMSTGTGKEKQLGLVEFAQQYGATTVTIKRVKKTTQQKPPLTNDFVPVTR
jgi:hypothetical protein